ncbi:MAG: hypothetical protein DLM73_13385 [Chthoniobacterales bacterium]|nr:MAG: hypothetical protein DLM73_13385 [Chthoniobacterales bacterium]
MKMKNVFTVMVLLSLAAIRTQATPVDGTIASLNADAQKPGGPERVLKSISASTHVPVATLEKGKAKFNLSYGDLYMAHSIANASGKSFDEIAARKAKGDSWQKIADANNVSLDGKKKVVKQTPKGTPTPAPKNLSDSQRDQMNRRSDYSPGSMSAAKP